MAGPGSFLKGSGDIIYQSDYNAIQSVLASAKGYFGLPMVSSPLGGTNVINNDHWNNLRQDMVDLQNNQVPRIKWDYRGSYSWTVPNYIAFSTITVDVIGAGGGGGGLGNAGDAWTGNGGGSGGVYPSSILSISGGQTLYIDVGAGGLGGSSYYVGIWVCVSAAGYTQVGTNGGASSISGSISGTITAGGGDGAGNSVYAFGGIGYGGSPNGVTGANGAMNCLGSLPGGDNGTGYGRGGDGGSCLNGGCGLDGQDGYVKITWVQSFPNVKADGETVTAADVNHYWTSANVFNDYKY